MFIAFTPDNSGEPFAPGEDERILLWVLRRLIVIGPHRRCGAVVVALDRRFGERGAALLPLLRALTMALARHASRPITVAAPCAILVTPDETRLLVALRCARRGESPETVLAALVRPTAANQVAAFVDAIAATLCGEPPAARHGRPADRRPDMP